MPIDRRKIAELRAREDRRFLDERPRSRELLARARASMPAGVPMSWMVSLYAHAPVFIREAKGAYITDVDGHRYLDMNLADTSMACGYGLDVVGDAVMSQFRRGSQYLLPTEETIAVAEVLAARYGQPRWQFTLSATAGERGSDQDRPRLYRPRPRAGVRRQVPRHARRDEPGAGRACPRARGARPGEGFGQGHGYRGLQRSRRRRAGARARGDGLQSWSRPRRPTWAASSCPNQAFSSGSPRRLGATAASWSSTKPTPMSALTAASSAPGISTATSWCSARPSPAASGRPLRAQQ